MRPAWVSFDNVQDAKTSTDGDVWRQLRALFVPRQTRQTKENVECGIVSDDRTRPRSLASEMRRH